MHRRRVTSVFPGSSLSQGRRPVGTARLAYTCDPRSIPVSLLRLLLSTEVLLGAQSTSFLACFSPKIKDSSVLSLNRARSVHPRQDHQRRQVPRGVHKLLNHAAAAHITRVRPRPCLTARERPHSHAVTDTHTHRDKRTATACTTLVESCMTASLPTRWGMCGGNSAA